VALHYLAKTAQATAEDAFQRCAMDLVEVTGTEPAIKQFKVKLRTEYICLSCHAVFEEKYLRCPKCQARGLLCPRVVKASMES